MQTIHNRTVETEDETFQFASLDGDHWLPINQKLTEKNAAEFQKVINGESGTKPMTFTTAAIDWIEKQHGVG